MAGRKRVVGRQVLTAAFASGEPVTCEYCGRRLRRIGERHIPDSSLAVADHRIPFARGGCDVAENIAISCRQCDRQKGPLTGDEFMRLRTNDAERNKLIAFVLLSVANRDLRARHERDDRRLSRQMALDRNRHQAARRRAS